MKKHLKWLSAALASVMLFSTSLFASAETAVPVDVAPILLSQDVPGGAIVTAKGIKEFSLTLSQAGQEANMGYGTAYVLIATNLSQNTSLIADLGDMDGNLAVQVLTEKNELLKKVTFTPEEHANKVTEVDLGLADKGEGTYNIQAVYEYDTNSPGAAAGEITIHSLTFAPADYDPTAKVETIGIDPADFEAPAGENGEAVKFTTDGWAFKQQFAAAGTGYPADVTYAVCNLVVEGPIDLSKYAYLYVNIEELQCIANVDVSIDGVTFTNATNYPVGTTGWQKISLGSIVKDDPVVDELLIRVTLVEDPTQSKTNSFGGLFLSNAAFDPEKDIPTYVEDTTPETTPPTQPEEGGDDKPVTGYAFPAAALACMAVSVAVVLLVSKKAKAK